MNRLTTTLSTIALTVAAGTALAQEATPDTWLNTAASTQSRAQVQAELARARAAGELNVFRAGYIAPVAGTKLRTDVVAEVQRARASGELSRINAEVPSLAPAAAQPAEPVYARAN